MNGIQDLYGQPYAQMDPQSSMDGYSQPNPTMDSLDSDMVGQSQTLDQIFIQNNEELMRRRSAYNPQQYQTNGGTGHRARRSSMMEFGTSDLADFQFDPNPALSQIPQQMPTSVPSSKPLDPRRVRSKEELALNTQFSQMSNDYDMNSTATPYSAGVMGSANDPNTYMSTGMAMDMDFDALAREPASMNMNPALSQQMYASSPMSTGFPASYATPNHDPGAGMNSPHTPMHSSRTPHSTTSAPANFLNHKFRRNPSAPMAPSPLSMSGPAHANSVMPSPLHMQNSMSRRQSMDGQSPYPPHGPSKQRDFQILEFANNQQWK